MGDWKYVNGGWEYDSGAPDADPTVTSMLPVYAAGDAAPVGGGLTYSRFIPTAAVPTALGETELHVRAHLSSVAEHDDNPNTRAADVQITHRVTDTGTLVVGFLPGARPNAPYLQPGYDPDTDRTGYTFRRWVPEGVSE